MNTNQIWRSAFTALARSMRGGTVLVHDVDGTTTFGSGEPKAEVTVHDERFWASLRQGSRGFGEAYVEGWFDCDQLTTLCQVLLQSLDPLVTVSSAAARGLAPILDPMRRARHRANPDRDRANIRAHYDLSNDFYELMLDETMAYSCGIFAPGSSDLTAASRAKFDRLCDLLELSPETSLLEIGTGWGGLAMHAARRHGCPVTTTTISQAQYELARRRVPEAGLEHLVTVRRDDYRDLSGQWDRIVSVEMIEAVDWREHRAFFSQVGSLVRPGGLVALQAIVIDDHHFHRSKSQRDFIKDQVFPGGCLPSIDGLLTDGRRAGGLRVLDVHDIGEHYPPTLRAWRAAVHRNVDAVLDLGLDERFLRLWDLYLAYCEAGFLEGQVSDVQILYRR